jgi:hypothetical protein
LHAIAALGRVDVFSRTRPGHQQWRARISLRGEAVSPGFDARGGAAEDGDVALTGLR